MRHADKLPHEAFELVELALWILGGLRARRRNAHGNECALMCVQSQSADFALTERGFRNANERFLHAMIHAYLDDSGDEKRVQYAACGGVFGEDVTMTFTEAFWQAEVKDLKEPFRSTDCECQHGQFKTWKKKDCDALMGRLVGVLTRTGMQTAVLGTAVPVPLFREIFPDAQPDDAQRLAIRHVLVSLVKIARRRNERVKVWFESGPTDADALRAYNEVRAFNFPNVLERDRLAGIAFGDKTMYALQAADLAAREAFKAASNRGKRPRRKPLLRMWFQTGILEFSNTCLVRLRDAGGPLAISAIEGMGKGCHPHKIDTTPYSVRRTPV
jgi:hypothetical protein